MGNDLIQGGDLHLVHHADQHILLLAGVHPPGGDQGGGMTQMGDDLTGDFLGVLGDNLKADGLPAAAHGPLHHRGGGEAVDDAQNHRLHLEVIYEIAAHSHDDIEDENQAVDALLGVLHMDQGCHKIRSAGVSPGLGQDRHNKAHDDTCCQRPQNGAGAVVRGIGEGRKIHMVQNQKSQRKGDHIHHAPQSNGLAHFEIHQHSQRNIDDQAEVAHPKAGEMLHHGADTVETRGGKLVGKHKQLIVHRTQQCSCRNGEIGQNFSQGTHRNSPEEEGIFPGNYFSGIVLGISIP